MLTSVDISATQYEDILDLTPTLLCLHTLSIHFFLAALNQTIMAVSYKLTI